jgi:integrase
MLSYARERKILRYVPEIELYEEEGREQLIEPWVEDLLLASASDWMRAALILGLDTGMRPGEIARLRWENFNWTEGTILVERGKSRRARRTVALTDRAKAELKARMAKIEGEWVFPSDGGKSGRVSKAGHILSGSFDKAFTALKDKINAEQRKHRQPLIPAKVVFYCTRHTFATMFLVNGGDVGTLMYRMGHASLMTTQKYLHLAAACKGAEVMNKHNKAKRGMRLVKEA